MISREKAQNAQEIRSALIIALALAVGGQLKWPADRPCAHAAAQTPETELSCALEMIQTYREGDGATGAGRGSEKLLADANRRFARLAQSLPVERRGGDLACLKAHRYWVETAYRLDWLANQKQRGRFKNMAAIRKHYLKHLIFPGRLDDDQRVVYNHYLGNVYMRMFLLERLMREKGQGEYGNEDNFFFCGLSRYSAALEADGAFLPSLVNVVAALNRIWHATKSSTAAHHNVAVCQRAIRAHIGEWRSLGLTRQTLDRILRKAEMSADPDAALVSEPDRHNATKRTPTEQVAFLEILGAAWLPSDKKAFEACVNNTGVLLLADGDLEKARGFFERRVAADPSNVSARMGLATALSRLGGYHNALAEEQLFIINEKLWLER